MLLVALLLLGFISVFVEFAWRKSITFVNRYCQLVLTIMFLFSLSLIFIYRAPVTFHFKYFEYASLHFNLSFYFDHLTWLMLCLISFISLNIHSYSARYLISDSNQPRFIAQLTLLTTSVMMLVSSGNLLTGFISWQLIGISLYLLLNHFHFNKSANRSAKKKFVINRLGDACFLLAVITAYLVYGSSEYSVINSIPNGHATPMNTIILSLVFVAVMTKSAQFPFHIWLIDTFEAPTPVSALMHAGIINAGGFILARLSPALSSLPVLLIVIFSIGLITAFLGKYFMQTQPDIKKQLAYSTMGQMGYMVMQCGLSCFGSAVFHLIAHGFFKSTLLLNSGSNLNQNNWAATLNNGFLKSNKSIKFIVSLALTAILVLVGYAIETHFANQDILNLFLWFFIAVTLFSLVNLIVGSYKNVSVKLLCLLLLTGFYLFYLFLLFNFIQFTRGGAFEHQPDYLSGYAQWVLIVILLLIAAFLKASDSVKKFSYLKKILFSLSYYKFNIEKVFRQFLLAPFRWSGDVLIRFNKKLSLKSKLLIFFLILVLISFLALRGGLMIFASSLCLSLMIVALIAANRNREGSQLILNLAIMVFFYFLLFAFQDDHRALALGLFFLFNISLIILTLLILVRSSSANGMRLQYKSNRLAIGNFYMSLLFILMMGLPGTASFITEFYMTYFLAKISVTMIFFWLCSMIFLSVVILHALQDNVFASGRFSRTALYISPKIHFICCLTISINFICGLFPNFVISNISNLIRVV